MAASRSFSENAPLRPRKSRKIRIAENQVGRQLVFLAQCFEFHRGEFSRLFRQRGALVKHPADFFAQLADAPAFDTAHLGVEIPLQMVFQEESARRNDSSPIVATVSRESFHRGRLGPDLPFGISFAEKSPGQTPQSIFSTVSRKSPLRIPPAFPEECLCEFARQFSNRA